MDIEQEKSRIKKWITGYLALGFIFLIIGLAIPLFLILTAMFLFIASRMFKDFKELDEEVSIKTNIQEIVKDLEGNQINTEVKMEKTNEEKELLLEVLSKDEDINLFLKVTNGQTKFALFEKIKAELEAKPKKKQEILPTKKPKEEPDNEEEDEEIVVEE